MTDDEMRALSTLETRVGSIHDELLSLNKYLRDEMSPKVTEVYVLRHPQGKCVEIDELKKTDEKTDVRLRSLEGNWRLLLGVLAGGLTSAGGIGALVARLLGG